MKIGLERIKEAVAADMLRKLPHQRQTQRENLSEAIATILHLQTVNTSEIAAGLPRKAKRMDMRYQWLLRWICRKKMKSMILLEKFGNEVQMIQFKGSHFTKEIIMMSIRWYMAYPLSYRQIEELLAERGVAVDHATINRWVVRYAPLLEKKFRNLKRAPCLSWRADETYIKVKGQWTYYYRAVHKKGDTIDFMLSPTRDQAAAEAFFRKSIDNHGIPTKVNIDKSGANLAALIAINKLQHQEQLITIRQVKYLNNQIEQDHRAIKRLTRPMLGFKNFFSAEATLAGIELCHMIKKHQSTIGTNLPIWEQFYALAA